MAKTDRAQQIHKRLKKSYPKVQCALNHHNALELLVATILAAQCTDKQVNQITPALFKKYRTAKAYANARLPILEREIRSAGFHHQKARSIKKTGALITEKHNGTVPITMEKLVELPGVWRKTANVILGVIHKKPAIIVDTHVRRVSFRMGLTREEDPDKIEADLQKILPKQDWTDFSHRVTTHGRTICTARRPRCNLCSVEKLCAQVGVTQQKVRSRNESL
ncbi:MAG: endonuclease III [Proteobacteria bacterium]|nr:endonuclease III [Pseudomonadota bacterium]